MSFWSHLMNLWSALNPWETNRRVAQNARDLLLLDVRMARAEAELRERGVIVLAPVEDESDSP
jgi:hypothetical protein